MHVLFRTLAGYKMGNPGIQALLVQKTKVKFFFLLKLHCECYCSKWPQRLPAPLLRRWLSMTTFSRNSRMPTSVTGQTIRSRQESLPRRGTSRKDLAGPLVPTQDKVCIVGAGTCGLYLALMLRYWGFSDFDILESSDRVGGRCYTHKVTGDAHCPHNY